MIKKLLFVLALALLGSQVVLAQTGTITGQVLDSATGEPVTGANVYLTELARGAASDVDGNFRISNVPAGTYNMTASYIGYRTYRQTVTVTAGQVLTLEIRMQAGALGLEEVVVSGYGVTPKREVTGAISSVRSSEIQNVSLQNAESILQGRAAGVTVTATSGNPGGAFQVNIRGNGSVNAATTPLYIVDGVQISFDQLSAYASTSPLNTINPSDIESIEILKDAAASAIYGAQAAAGVVIITTKQGRQGRTIVTANVERGIRSLARNVNYITSEQYVDYLGEGLQFRSQVGLVNAPAAWTLDDFKANRRAFLLGFFGEDPNNAGNLAETDWQDFIFSEGSTEKYSISLSGGNETTSFFLSGGWEDTEGTAFRTDFTRLSLRTNLDHQVNSRLSTSLRLNLSRSTQFGVCQDGNFINCPPSQAMFEAPMSFPYKADGTYSTSTRFGVANNPATQMFEVDRNVGVIQILARLGLTYRVNDWLSLSGQATTDYRNTQENQWRSPLVAPAQGGWIQFINRNVYNSSGNFVANFRQALDGGHNVSGLVGTEYRRNFFENHFVVGDGMPGSFFKVLTATSTPTQAAGSNGEWRLGSYFTQLRYNFDERYYVTFVGRYDGHSRFGAENRWGFFPSISGSWRISEESFWSVDAVNELRLRLGYGTTGNSDIGNFAARGLFSAVGSYMGATGLQPTQLANAALGWEEAEEVNIGLDFELLQGRIFGALDVYQKDNNNLLFGRPLPLDSGFGSITENIGSVRNTGLEFEVNSVNLNTRGFQWQTRFNVAFTQNEIMELPDGNDISPSSAFNSLQIGKPIGLIQTAVFAGVNPADGRPMWFDINGNITYTPDVADLIEYNDGQQNVVGGFGNTFNYKGFSLDAFLQFSFGQWAFASTDYYFTRTPDFLMNLHEDVLKRWRQPGDITSVPRAIIAGTDYRETNDWRVQVGTNAINNASYIRLKNVSASYQIPTRFTESLGIQSARLYASAINLITWTAWPWYDPEVAFSPFDIYNNVTTASYPTERQVYAGIELRF
jgi:TonB-dependent starch-binding outer membrane protein SusC